MVKNPEFQEPNQPGQDPNQDPSVDPNVDQPRPGEPGHPDTDPNRPGTQPQDQPA